MPMTSRGHPGLKRSITLPQAIMYGVGLILGAGIYVLIGDVAAISGNTLWISFIVAAIIATLTGLSYAELTSIFPKSAAEYVFVKEAFGVNFLALIVGCLIIFVAVTSAAAVSVGFSGYLAVFLPQYPHIIYAIILVIVLSFVNFYGITESVWTNIVFTLVEITGLLIIIIVGFTAGSITEVDYLQLPPSAAKPSHISAISIVLASTTLIFFAYYGFENIANISEETKDARRVIPRALLLSILITTILYVLVGLSSIALVGWKEMASSEAPLAVVASKALGDKGMVILTSIALFATTNTVLMMLISGSRIIYGMAKDNAFSVNLATIHGSRRTPWIAVALTMVLTLITILLSSGSIVMLASVSVFGILTVFGLVNLSVIWLRFKQPALHRSFASPFTWKKFPILAGLGLVTTAIIMFQFGTGIIISTSLVLVSIIILCIVLTITRRGSMTRGNNIRQD
jgi:APA family basic amino acid/polyamine antiporter